MVCVYLTNKSVSVLVSREFSPNLQLLLHALQINQHHTCCWNTDSILRCVWLTYRHMMHVFDCIWKWQLVSVWTQSLSRSTVTKQRLVSSVPRFSKFPQCSCRQIFSLSAHSRLRCVCSPSLSHTTAQIQNGPRWHTCLCKYVYSVCAVGCDTGGRSCRILHEPAICINQLLNSNFCSVFTWSRCSLQRNQKPDTSCCFPVQTENGL